MDTAAKALAKFKNLRYYQSESVQATAARLRKTRSPLLIVLPTGSGKSWVIAALAAVVQALAGKSTTTGKRKKVLVLAPSAELVDQNHQKMVQSGFSASIYSADLKIKDVSGDVVFGSHLSVNKDAPSFVEDAHEFAAVFIDEAHAFLEQAQSTVEILKELNPNIRVVGLTATPYRMRFGYIYQQDVHRNTPPLSKDFARDPYFSEMVYEKSPHEMIEEGFLTPPVLGEISDHYDISKLRRHAGGGFTKASTDNVFVSGKGNLTKEIIREVKQKAKKRKGIMIFAQNREHAKQILSYLPAKQSALIDSHTNKTKDRPEIIAKFKSRKLKYLVNVNTLTKGFDAPHVDMIAVLRHTESPALFQQIIGRGLRLSPETGKKDCLILDYAQNLPADGDIFSPTIVAAKLGNQPEVPTVEVRCPACEGINTFRAAKPFPNTAMDEYGYLKLVSGDALLTDLGEPVAGHLGVQCTHYRIPEDEGNPYRCKHVWGRVECPSCHTLNSAMTHFCRGCSEPLSKSARRLGMGVSRDQGFTHRVGKMVEKWTIVKGESKAGRLTLRIDALLQELPYVRSASEEELKDDPDQVLILEHPAPESQSFWLNPEVTHPKAQASWKEFLNYAQKRSPEIRSVIKTEPLNAVMSKLQSGGGFEPEAPSYLVYIPTPSSPFSTRKFYEIISYDYAPGDKTVSP
jgi:DNA repair protein RadD